MTAPLQMRLREARERKGLTQQEVANAVGVGVRTVGNWERGESIPRNRLAKLEDLFGVRLRAGSVGPPAYRPGMAGLTDDDLVMLQFEEQWWKRTGNNAAAIRRRFGLTAPDYYRRLDVLIDRPEAMAVAGLVVRRLRAQRATTGWTARRPVA